MNETQEFNYTLTLDEINTVLVGLGKLPAEQSFQLILKLRSETEAQIAAQQPAEPPKE